MRVLDKGFVELEDFMGGDLRVANSAKVSFQKFSTEMTSKETGLISFLMKHRHGSPFEHNYFTFRVKAPLFVVREWQRHRIGSFNEMSGRYVEFNFEVYEPAQWRVPAETNKQGSVVNTNDIDNVWGQKSSWDYADGINASFRAYKDLLRRGVAKEMARMVLPLSLYTEFFWTVNARSLMNFLALRTNPDAQWEIQEFARAVEIFFKDKMPVTYEAWITNNKLAP